MNPGNGEARIVINGGERIIRAPVGRPVLFALMGERIFIPSACGGRASCGQCRVRVLSGASDHVPEERAILSEEERARGIHLACQTRPRGEISIHLPAASLRARQFACRVGRIRDLARDMREVDLELVEPEGMSFEAGQYVQFLLPGTEHDPQPVYRAYSMASPPSCRSRLTLLMARVPGGACTTYVFDRLRTGQRVTVNGPFGEFTLRESTRRILFIASGSGIAPIRGLLHDMAEKRIARPAAFLYSARTAADLVYHEEMQAMGRRLPGFTYVPILTHPRGDEPWDGERGGLPAALARLLPTLTDHEAYLCGGPGMVDASLNALRSKGVREELIFFDKFS